MDDLFNMADNAPKLAQQKVEDDFSTWMMQGQPQPQQPATKPDQQTLDQLFNF